MDPFEKALPDATVKALIDGDAGEHMLPDTPSDIVFVDGIGFPSHQKRQWSARADIRSYLRSACSREHARILGFDGLQHAGRE